ncbi:AI-2E family transporter [Candidatus Parcubacteria bacterium]|nr:AI-2E family transporter [Candidatus Parcubacteria bacterium]
MEEPKKLAITTGSWVRGVIVILLAYAFLLVGRFVLVLIAAIVIASALESITKWSKKRGIPRLPTVIGVYFITAVLFAGFFYFLLLPLIGEVSSFIKTLTVYSNSVVNGSVLSNMFATQNLFGGLHTPQVISQLNTYLNALSGFLSQGVFSSLSVVFGGVVSFVLMLVLSFYLAVQDDGIGKFLRIITPDKHESYVINLWRRSQAKIGRWLQGQLLLGLLIMVMVYVALLIIDVPHALLLAVVAGVLELIPLFGPVLAAIPAIFVSYTDAGMTTALIVIGVYLLIQQLENHVIYPVVVKKMIGIPPMVSILALVIGGELAGFLGILISVPVATVVMEFLNDLEEEKIAKSAKEANA